MVNFDLEERTAKFVEEIIDLCRKVKIGPLNIRIITQLIGSGGSINTSRNSKV